MKYHPDRQTDPIAKDLANEKLKKVNEAREFLLDNYKYYGNSSTHKSSNSKNYSGKSSTSQTKKKKRSNTKTKVQETRTEFEAEPINEKEEIKPEMPTESNGFGFVALVFFIIFIIAHNSFEDKTNSNISNSEPMVVKLNVFDDYQPTTETKTKTEVTPQKEVKQVEEIQEEPKRVEVKPVQQKPLTEEERIAKFEKEMTKTFDDYINAYGRYYDYPQLKDRTFTVDISSYLNNSLYSCKYICGDFEQQYEASKLYFDFESLMRGLPIYFRDDAKTNYEMRYKMRVTHTPQGTTVKLLDVWHYLEGDYR